MTLDDNILSSKKCESVFSKVRRYPARALTCEAIVCDPCSRIVVCRAGQPHICADLALAVGPALTLVVEAREAGASRSGRSQGGTRAVST